MADENAAASASFSVLLLTAAPQGHAVEAGGAYVKIDGREALLRSVELFLNRDNVKQVQIVFNPDEMEEAKRKFGGHLGFSGVKIIPGGPTWADQLAAAAEKIAPDASHVIVHDAARPAVPYTDIEALMEAAGEGRAVAVLTAPLRASLLELDEGRDPVAHHTIAHYVQLLWPQALARGRFAELAKKKQEPHASEMCLVKGSPLNVRVAGPGDAALVKQMINMLPKRKLAAPSSPFEEAQW
ncbi:MAG TPA: 2-C-methyl-D-erythritol 4-phosphate cytidylyltransferase [Tepidisphaeraceae bacterium]|nr:2-C-methyl-D-erythritol 4-phosphate cytidylyltransferase [Tepidisphaeraceae bacterium]